MKNNENKKGHFENVPEIFKDLWGFNFVEEISFSKIKNEMPKIQVVVAHNDEDKTKMLQAVLQKYGVPFSNLKIISNDNEQERGAKPKITTKKKIQLKANSSRFHLKVN